MCIRDSTTTITTRRKKEEKFFSQHLRSRRCLTRRTIVLYVNDHVQQLCHLVLSAAACNSVVKAVVLCGIVAKDHVTIVRVLQHLAKFLVCLTELLAERVLQCG